MTAMAEGAKLSFTIADSNNPKTGAPTSVYKLYLRDKDGYVKSEKSGGVANGGQAISKSMKLEMLEPALITESSLKAIDERQNAYTAFRLEFDNKMPYPTGSYVVVDFDPSEIGPKDDRDKANVKCLTNL